MSKRLGGIIGCQGKTSSCHLNGFPDGSNIGSTVQCRGEAHRCNVHSESTTALDVAKGESNVQPLVQGVSISGNEPGRDG